MAVITIREKQPTAEGFAASLIFEGGEYPINITDPFTPKEERQLEWYFEEWLTYPMLNGKKAEAAKTSVVSYGESLFNQVFKADIDAYSFYRQLRVNLKQVKIEIVGNSPEFHALHWEALRDKDWPRPLSVDCVMIRKRLDKAASVAANMAESPIINLLVVIARPDEEHDVGYRTIARPLIEVIQKSHLPVNIDLLRPGTYESLERHLEAKGAGYYHIIHFDCHGALMGYADIQEGVKRNRYTYQARWGREDIQPYEGVKAFLFLDGESKGKADPVEAGELANLLTGKGIPVCILNACQSGKQVRGNGEQGGREQGAGEQGETEENGRETTETSLGSRLMTAGMEMVVAMGYSVTVSAARLMMEQVYQNLFGGKEISEAIRLGRRELFNNKTRKAYFNTDIDLEDWLLPVVYSNQLVNLNLRKFRAEEEEEYFDKLGSLYQYTPPEYGFIGRDLEILKIEKALFRHNILLLQGMGGTGKTTLLNYLRSWWQTTNFAPEIFYFGYDQQAWTLTQILFEIGKRVYKKFEFANFQAMNLTAQMQKLLAKLRSESHILILDNLESVTGQALAIQNTLASDEQKQLQDFLTRLGGGETRVILGSRSDETWLQGAFKQNIYQLRGLDAEARTELSNKILERNVGDENKIGKIREEEDFQKLMKVLAGYPLAMEVVLANLKSLSSQEILAKLAAADINLDTGSEDKTQSILKCVEYSHSNLSADAQKLLLCLAPFSGFIDRSDIPNYAKQLQKLEQFQEYDFDKFDEAIQEAINWGLLSDLSPNPSPARRGAEKLLQIQPVFPFFLKAKLAESDAATREALREGFKNHYIGLARDYNRYMESKEPQERQIGIFFCRLEYENLYNALQICLEKQETIDIFFCLSEYLKLINDIPSRLKLSEFVCKAQVAYPPEIRTGEIGLEIVMALDRLAMGYLQTQNYPQAQESYLRVIELSQQLQGVEATQIKSSLASTYHQLGYVAQKLRQYDQAGDYYQQALEIKIEFGDRYSCASTYHQLGNVAQELRQYDQAWDYYQQALEIKIEFGDRYSCASTYHQLGSVAEELRQYDQAWDYYQQALEINIEFGDRYSCARTYHQLGSVAEDLRQYDQARDYYQQALEIKIEFGDRYTCARTYHQLGSVAQQLRQYDQARDYYQQALEIFIEFGDRYTCASTYHQLGRVAQELRQYDQARDYYQQALEIFIEFGDRYTCASTYHQLGRVAQELRQYHQARDYYQQALEIFIEFGDRYSQALTLHCLGTLAQAEENYAEARANLQTALEIYVEYQDEYWAKVVRGILEDLPE
ncbi:Tfp pilus assembly protein PilF [Nostoc linckia z18]|uniref:Tfp pilus assembly protein PilF n=1 Tax=Nostoc linckia z8 TaxID=1628746 RepID=A0A9Q5Z8N5_NOSLI|nr:tetratricopeptide repeat protein [Nostoc linckia]PHJ63574.1 Tfp pilus assembly protein PilF [Nostoc linckia z3]PHJ65509.1 Tfp pilus assembly protein PilF [Nostoc linckia z1]PHJ76992.1 Tfp pilus assembly protein PilF [Nostoc linckia z2]PHJ81903.1 Tfp pilus assembly protein PilF [Nostoc linckia z4]PHJ89415.1 Tfp pilus assembly protein PilF [Nostoc linckia z6]